LVEKTERGDKNYFRIQIALDQTQLISKSGKKVEIAPGMSAEVDIITGNRSVLAYLTKPVTKTFSESFHER
jgi:multidrug efflux pump subunit AcrA (membrane-fusion protein)